MALGRIASLALANLKRVEMERRAAEIDADLNAAAAAQKWILPARERTVAGFRVVGESRPGRGVGGDFFDVVELGPRRLAVALGDVSGKGVSAGVLMTATQGYLHAALQQSCGGPGPCPPAALADVVARLAAFVNPRRPASRFVTLWVAVLDADAGTLTYVDAGHGLGMLRHADGRVEELAEAGGVPVGILPDAAYDAATVPLAPGDSVLIVSDGLSEQPAPTAGHADEFGPARIATALATDSPDPVAALFTAVVAHAGTDKLADDATAVLVRRGERNHCAYKVLNEPARRPGCIERPRNHA